MTAKPLIENPETVVGGDCGDVLKIAMSPRDVGLAAEDSPILYAAYQAWRAGHLTWERAMMQAAVCLARENQSLREEVQNLRTLKLPDPVQIGDAVYEYAGPCPSCSQMVVPALRHTAKRDL